MQMLNLSRVNHATIIQETPQNEGMLHKAKDYITWGKIDVKTLESLLRNRGRLAGDHPLTDAAVSAGSQHENIEGFAAALASNDAKIRDVTGLKPIFRLHPPRGTKGWGGIKRSFAVGGALGNRGDAMGDLVTRMI